LPREGQTSFKDRDIRKLKSRRLLLANEVALFFVIPVGSRIAGKIFQEFHRVSSQEPACRQAGGIIRSCGKI